MIGLQIITAAADAIIDAMICRSEGCLGSLATAAASSRSWILQSQSGMPLAGVHAS
jgi:hypothetical protein